MPVEIAQQLTNIEITYNPYNVTVSLPVVQSGGGGAVDSVNGLTGVVVLNPDNLDDTSSLHKFVTESDLINLSNLSGINTGDQDLSGLAEKTNVLELDNTSVYTPTLDYHPSTKKYVDDNAGSSTEFQDDEFRLVDSVTGYKQIFDTSELTANRGLTLPNFDFVISNHFDSSGNVYATKYKMDNSITLKNTASNRLDVTVGGSETVVYRMYSSVYFQLHANAQITHGSGAADGSRDVGIQRLQAGMYGITLGSNGTRGELDFKYPEYTTVERTGLPNVANTTVYDTDLNKIFTNDGSSWNAHW